MELSELQKISHEQSTDKGFWGLYDDLTFADFGDGGEDIKLQLQVAILSQKLALVSSEVTEALEDLRDGHEFVGEDALTIADSGKPEGFASELADVIIRVLDLGGALGINLEDVIVKKLKYNANSRGKLHGRRF